MRQTILIVDDTPDHRDILSRFLHIAGYRVIAASSSSEAIEQVARERPDLILAALSLPGHAAWETTRQLLATIGLDTTPILGTTVFSTLLTGSRVRAIGCAGVVEKPFDFDTLLYHIGQLMPPHPLAPTA